MKDIYVVWDLDDDNIVDEAGVHFTLDTAEVFMVGWKNCNDGNYEVRKYIFSDYITSQLEKMDFLINGFGEYDVCNPSDIPYQQSFEGSDFEKLQMVLGKIQSYKKQLEEELQ